jgi:ABC-2 type transport system ATP-binding protein
MFGLLGSNGAGKSTLMRTVATLQEPDSGSIQLDNLALLEQTKLWDVRKKALGTFSGGMKQRFGVAQRCSAIHASSGNA